MALRAEGFARLVHRNNAPSDHAEAPPRTPVDLRSPDHECRDLHNVNIDAVAAQANGGGTVDLPAAKAASGSVFASAVGASPARWRPKRGRAPRLHLDAGKLGEASVREMVVRFGFGAATSALAGVVSVL